MPEYDYSWLDRPTLKQFTLAYQKAKDAGQEEFTFVIQGKEYPVLVSFAKYLIQWRESELQKQGK